MSRTKRRNRPRTDILPSDYTQFKQMLRSKPRETLLHFAALQVTCLNDVPAFREIVREDAEAASRIVLEAAALGIAVKPHCPFRDETVGRPER